MINKMAEDLSIADPTPKTEEDHRRRGASVFVRNSAANVTRVGVTALIALLLPAYLTHHLPVQTYAAWVLILQLGAYVGYFDFGVQTAVAKYIAEYEAKGDDLGRGRCASVGLVIMLIASVLGFLLTLVLAWQVPRLFGNMPVSYYHGVRQSVLFVGTSLSLILASSVFSSIFLGLQRYQIPMMTGVASRLLNGIVIFGAVFLKSSLAAMGAATAVVNLFTALLQVVTWRKLASHVHVTLRAIDRTMLRQMLAYCGILAVWSAAMLFISGIDVTIVGHYAFEEVAFYSIATAPTNLILTITAAILAPFLPAASALSVNRSPEEMGDVLRRATQYSVILLLLLGLPVLMGGYSILRLWAGPNYALHGVRYLRILLLANVLRNFCAPYATMVVATSRQRVATASAITEGLVNLVASIWLAKSYGAIGVALGTLLGSVVGVAMHFFVSMHYTQTNLAISRQNLLLSGILRPMIMSVPSALLLPYWWRNQAPSLGMGMWILWAASTLLLAWYGSFTETDRALMKRILGNRIRLSAG
jgi:O-antigen/teichoic acid export membrane protein